MYLTTAQFEILRSWAEETPQVRSAYLFGSYTKGEAHSDSDIDIAIDASPGDWTALASEWERDLTDKLGITVNIRTLLNDTVRAYCAEFSVPLKT